MIAPRFPQFLSPAPPDLFFSEYIEGSSNNKAMEIYNNTGSTIDLAGGNYDVQMLFNGSSSAGLIIALTGTVDDGDLYVLAHCSTDESILAQADQTNGAGWFNGYDSVILRKNGTIIDAIGQVGFDPGTEWGSGDQSPQNNTLRRKASVCQGDTNETIFSKQSPSVDTESLPLNALSQSAHSPPDPRSSGSV
ncbi:MAG: lamin tail domain-containing protein [Chloroflexota bacterium]|nr:lamin tail domain-containing protein [Chloroflexota bacterium]